MTEAQSLVADQLPADALPALLSTTDSLPEEALKAVVDLHAELMNTRLGEDTPATIASLLEDARNEAADVVGDIRSLRSRAARLRYLGATTPWTSFLDAVAKSQKRRDLAAARAPPDARNAAKDSPVTNAAKESPTKQEERADNVAGLQDGRSEEQDELDDELDELNDELDDELGDDDECDDDKSEGDSDDEDEEESGGLQVGAARPKGRTKVAHLPILAQALEIAAAHGFNPRSSEQDRLYHAEKHAGFRSLIKAVGHLSKAGTNENVASKCEGWYARVAAYICKDCGEYGLARVSL